MKLTLKCVCFCDSVIAPIYMMQSQNHENPLTYANIRPKAHPASSARSGRGRMCLQTRWNVPLGEPGSAFG